MTKVALVVGNSKYGEQNDVSGVEDARAMASCLERLGFLVLPPVLDAKLTSLRKALADFKQKMAGAQVVVFFYSGHGFQNANRNYLLPPGSPVTPTGSLPLSEVLGALGSAPAAALKFAFLDACRDDKRLPADAPRGLAEAPGAAVNVLQAFAASPGQVAASGSRDGLSPYTTALLRYLPEPGLALAEFFDKVRTDVFRDSPRQQQPVVSGALPVDFFFRDPVFVDAIIPEPQSDLLVILNGDVVLDTDRPKTARLRLKARDNELILLVSSPKTYRNNHDWDITEGWRYRLDLVLPGGRTETFADEEDHPFKAGPHHGKVFKVARAQINVHPETAAVTLVAEKDLADREAPFFARQQGLLYFSSITELNLSPDDVLGDVIGTEGIAAILRPFLVEFLKTGTILGQAIADPDKTFVTVHGNRALQSLAQAAMAQRDERIRDLRASIAAAFRRVPTPFDLFDQGLMASMRSVNAAQGSPFPPEDIRIWTAFEDRSHETPPEPV